MPNSQGGKRFPQCLCRGKSECTINVVQIWTTTSPQMLFENPVTSFNHDSMANQQPYNYQNQGQNLQFTPQNSPYRNQTFDQQQVGSILTASIGTAPGASSTHPQTSFRAPAHKHAHHLHSIPPREKSTRTLIVDHMLWVHGRTRFAQARAELGMTDRTGGPTSPNYSHRSRPEGYEEEEEDGSEGEEVVVLKPRTGDPSNPHNDEEEDRLKRQDLALARSLRIRAEGLEKVITSMLDQPPPVHPLNDEDVVTPPTSPKLNATSLQDPHRLPNGVRLRLALGTIVNDLFARQAPRPPYRHAQPTSVAKAPTPTPSESSALPTPSDLPDALIGLAPVSGAFAHIPRPPAQHHPPSRVQSSSYNEYPSHYSYQSQNQAGSSQIQFAGYHSQPPPLEKNIRPRPSPRTRELYIVGSDPSTANSPPAFRCPRHLHTGCEICVEAKSPPRPTGNSRGRSSSSAAERSGGGPSSNWRYRSGSLSGGGLTGWQDGSGVGSGLLRPGVVGNTLRRKAFEKESTSGGGNTKLSKLVPRFIRLSALVAAELGREARGEEDDSSSDDERGGTSGGDREDAAGAGGSTAGTPATPSGNVSTPGRSPWGGPGGGYTSLPASPSITRATTQNHASRERTRMYDHALRPSREWYMLLAGLLTRSVLEGYLTAGWNGLQGVQCLLMVGLGINENAKKKRDTYEEDENDEDDDEIFAEFDPDELPTLIQAVRILFPSLREGSSGVKDQAEEEFEIEMLGRLRRFYDIPISTPDCSTHMEDLAWSFPAEPVERAAVRYCEAISRWRGKPELQTKPQIPEPTSPGGTTPMTIDSLVHSNPTSPVMPHSGLRGSSRRRKLKKPSIDIYFPRAQPPPSPLLSTLHRLQQHQQQQQHQQSQPSQYPQQPSPHYQQSMHHHHQRTPSSGSWNPNKRYREADDVGGPNTSKRMFAS
ncbi:hypothetical protein CPB83DRAFT_419110 [Crepidotus variabilis]|uniref:Uncharacterized protein n=1 Tax=Crepidotus variabilis TaxID=179855 RepID=A0A9P6ESD3_9AGAR|nr:hypothetical protein CPB83DRAFT_419110 [Crepidotus variabilis]